MHKCGLRPAVAFSIVVLHCIFPFEITMLEDSSVHVLHLCVNMTPRTSLESLGGIQCIIICESVDCYKLIGITTNTSVLA
jgi:hypothetical protein